MKVNKTKLILQLSKLSQPEAFIHSFTGKETERFLAMAVVA
jgi:hypothetical protein